MQYSVQARAARMAVTANMCAGGRLEIGTAGMATILVSLPLGRGQVGAEALTVPVEEAIALLEGTAAAARICAANGVCAIERMTVGAEGSGADVVLGSVKLSPGMVVSLGTLTIGNS